MTEIKKTALESFMFPLADASDIGKVSLFLVSQTNSGLKKLNLENFSPKERAAQLRLWGQEHRFVLVIEKGDTIFAHAHEKYVDQLQKLDGFSFLGRKINVKSLSDEEAAQVAAIGEAFEGHVLGLEGEGKVEGGEDESEANTRASEHQRPHQHSIARNRIAGDQQSTSFLVEQMVKRQLGKLISDCMKRYQEERAEQEKQRVADNKHFDIIRAEIKGEIRRSEVKKEEVSKAELNKKNLVADIDHTNELRGG